MSFIKNITKEAVVNHYFILCKCILLKIKFDCKLGYYNMLLDKTNSQKKFQDLRFPKLFGNLKKYCNNLFEFLKNKIFLVLKKL